MSEMIFCVIWALSHNGKDYVQGDEIEVDSDDAEPLLKSGVIELKSELGDVVSLNDIVSAINELEDDDFTNNGAPEVKALGLILDANITAEERDAAWTAYNE